MPAATKTKPKPKPKPRAAPRKRCQWCPNFLVPHGPDKTLVCFDCDDVARWPNV